MSCADLKIILLKDGKTIGIDPGGGEVENWTQIENRDNLRGSFAFTIGSRLKTN